MRSVIGKYGEIWFYGKDKFIGRGLFAYGEFSDKECSHILELAKEGGGLSLDVGANIGCISQMLEFHGMEVEAFEPQPRLVTCLERNFKGVIHNFALGDETKQEIMPKYNYTENGSFGQAELGQKSYLGSITVDVKPLDSIKFNKRISFIKIDVEGYEFQVLEGAKETILRDRPLMYIEDDRLQNSVKIRNFLDEMNYTYVLDETPLYNPNNFFGNKTNIWGYPYISYNLICKPC